jgi:hypothetical protein
VKKTLRTLACLAVLTLPLAGTAPALAQEVASQPANPAWGSRHHGMGYEGYRGFGCPMMMDHDQMDPGRPDGMMGQGMMPSEMMKPAGKETPEITQLRQDIMEQHKKLIADKLQMRADCQRMSELFQKMKELRAKRYMGPKSPTTKGNAAPQNPAVSGQ